MLALVTIFRICLVLALPVACLIWSHHLAGPGQSLIENKPFAALCNAQVMVRGPDGPFDCLVTDWLWLFQSVSWVALAVALVPVLLFVGAAVFCGTNRWLNAAIFPRLVRVAVLLVVANLIVQGLLLLLALIAFYLAYLGNPPLIALGIGAVGLLGVAGAVIVGAMSVDVEGGLSAMAEKVSRSDAPDLWDAVDQIAEVMESRPPDNIIVGYEPSFWVVSGKVELHGEGIRGRCKGETLFLSLPLMHVLSVEELISIIGHELGHFRGRDTAYSERFIPVFDALARARYDLDDFEDVVSSKPAIAYVIEMLSKIPARALLGMLSAIFAINVQRISRIREYEADAAATEVAEPRVLVSSLFKMPLYDRIWENQMRDVVARINSSRHVPPRLARHLGDAARLEVTLVEAEKLRKISLKAKAEHPYDSHPTSANRARALGVKPADIGAQDLRLSGEQQTSEILLSENTRENLEAVLMIAEFHVLRQHSKIRQLPGRLALHPPELFYHAVYGLLAALVKIAPDPAERFARASARGAEEMTEFDRVIFLEYCAGRREVPDGEAAAAGVLHYSGPEGGALMWDIVDDLLEPEEAEVRQWLAKLLGREALQ